jgi:hypothetical protein
LKFEVYDVDDPKGTRNSNDFIGVAEIVLADLVSSKKNSNYY